MKAQKGSSIKKLAFSYFINQQGTKMYLQNREIMKIIRFVIFPCPQGFIEEVYNTVDRQSWGKFKNSIKRNELRRNRHQREFFSLSISLLHDIDLMKFRLQRSLEKNSQISKNRKKFQALNWLTSSYDCQTKKPDGSQCYKDFFINEHCSNIQVILAVWSDGIMPYLRAHKCLPRKVP